jgi:O-antigen/teichoic acid export membrane protein
MPRSVLQRASEDRSVRASLLYVSSGILVQSVALVLSPLWTRAMTKEEFGIIAVVQPIAIFVATVAGLGLQNGVARLVHDEPRGSSGQLDIAKGVIAFQFMGLIAALSVSFLLIPGFATPLRNLLGFPATRYLQLALLGAFLTSAAGTLTQTSQALELPWPVFWSRLGESTSRGGLIVLLVVFGGMEGSGMLIARAGGAAAMLLLLAFGIRTAATGVIRPGVIRGALRFSLPLLPYQLSALLLDGADRIILNEFHGEASVAPYALAYAVGGGGMLLIGASVLRAEAPSFYQAMRSGEHALAGHRVIRRIEFLALIAIGLNVVGGPVIELVYDARYASSAALMPLIVSGLFFRCVFSFKNFTLMARKRTALSSGITVATAVANLGLNFVMIPVWGASGAAIATLLAYALQAVVGAIAERRLAPVPQYLGRLALSSAGVVISAVVAHILLQPSVVN